MHELGILLHIGKSVHKIAVQKGISRIKQITLEIGELSGVVPLYLRKLLPAAAEIYPFLKDVELRIRVIAGRGLVIKSIGYEDQ